MWRRKFLPFIEYMIQVPDSFSGDKSREGPTWAKILQPFRLMLPKNNHACAKAAWFSDINIAEINEALGTKIKGVILDVDECMAEHHGEITKENIDRLREMVSGAINAIIFSNMKATDRYKPVSDLADVHMSKYPKPDIRGFLECCEKLGLPPEQVLMIGDNLVTDGGAIRAGINFALVNPMETPGQSIGTQLRRGPQTTFRSIARAISDFHDRILGRKVFRPIHQ